MYRVLIADDEKIIRKGLCSIIDWNALGFEIIGEATNGNEVLSFLENNSLDLVMIDIRMPKLHGLDAIRKAREAGFEGIFIVLSGHADFAYAKQAIDYGILAYLTKPVDTDDLTATLQRAREKLDQKQKDEMQNSLYRSKAKETLLCDLLTGDILPSEIDAQALNLDHACYQVIIYEKYNQSIADHAYSFSDILRVINPNGQNFEALTIEGNHVILLKGNGIIDKFHDILSKYESELPPEENSPLDSIFITCGRPVTHLDDLSDSYLDAYQLLTHRFFCDQHQHVMDYTLLPDTYLDASDNTKKQLKEKYTQELCSHLQAFNRNKIAQTLNDLQQTLYGCNLTVKQEKNLLVDLYLSIKERILFLYSTTEIPFIENSEAIHYILHCYYLYEIITFLSEQFDMIMKSIGFFSRDSIIDDIVHYIDHNYAQNITLENIAPLFGYNSSYLGKIFSKKMGINFNTYLDNIRIEHSKQLLLGEKMQVYKIAQLVGYRNVDYFHIKFKKNTGLSPAEYRKHHTT